MTVDVRKFLNRKGYQGIASVHATWDGHGYGNLTISDCSRQVSISIDASNRGERNNTLYKLDILTDVISQLRLAVQEHKP